MSFPGYSVGAPVMGGHQGIKDYALGAITEVAAPMLGPRDRTDIVPELPPAIARAAEAALQSKAAQAIQGGGAAVAQGYAADLGPVAGAAGDLAGGAAGGVGSLFGGLQDAVAGGMTLPLQELTPDILPMAARLVQAPDVAAADLLRRAGARMAERARAVAMERMGLSGSLADAATQGLAQVAGGADPAQVAIGALMGGAVPFGDGTEDGGTGDAVLDAGAKVLSGEVLKPVTFSDAAAPGGTPGFAPPGLHTK
ncbi:MAG: hypothetical protein CMO30_01425 [Tistrella sp.]|uniref:hypothetical protein n=1 Tax=Tistrella sp. TaxID=2024861 RepID=UPI000C5DA0A3|nr:hypothetical protein [Tistrella sp.]MAD40276.1 hypothetical protein [Tistrella sp.]MBA73941.1 hypothetical protein [Tistrella sp.]